MDNQWQHHHHQPIQGNKTCPTCSISHFPFCPPHPSFNSSPRFPSPHQTHPFHAPNFNQYGLHPGPYNPNDLYRDPVSISLHKNPNLDRDSSHGFGYGSNGFGDGDGRNVKRVKVDGLVCMTRVISEEDERRLKLIREHGGSISGPPLIEGNLGIGSQEIENYNDLRGNIVGNSIKSPINAGSSGFRDPGQSFLRSKNVPSPHIFREEEHSSGFGNQYMQPQISQLGQYLISEAHNEISSYTPSAQNSEQISSISMENLAYNGQPVGSHGLQDSMHKEYDFRLPSIMNDTRHLSEVRTPLREGDQFPLNNTNQGRYLPSHMSLENINQMHASRLISALPPLPHSPPPPPPPPMDSPTNSSSELNTAYKPHLSQPYFQNNSQMPVSTGYLPEEARGIHQTSSQRYLGEGRLFPIMHMSADKRRMVNAFHLFKLPDRVSRPHHIVIILRGLPGSGKSYLAKMIRDLEVENGGDAPRIHSMDDYFMTEVEKVDESEMAKSTGSGRAKKPTSKVVMEYCYEPEMEEAYRSSMFKAFKKTIEDGGFTFIIVDDRNLRVADFAQFWAIAKRSGFEVYLLEATYKDPAGCAARNVHGFTQDDIHKMAKQWEEAPSWYLQLDIKSLFHGDDLKDGGIQEVDMDTGERDIDEDLSGTQVEKLDEHIEVSATGDHATGVSSLKDEKRWDGEGAEADHPAEQVKELGRSKWSDDSDEDDGAQTKGSNGILNSLSGLIQSYGKDGRSVHWGDQAPGNTGFSIGSAKKAKVFSLVIGAGSGYNLKSNPLPDVNIPTITNTGDRRNTFQQQLRVERESSKVIFDRRRHKIGLDVDEE